MNLSFWGIEQWKGRPGHLIGSPGSTSVDVPTLEQNYLEKTYTSAKHIWIFDLFVPSPKHYKTITMKPSLCVQYSIVKV